MVINQLKAIGLNLMSRQHFPKVLVLTIILLTTSIIFLLTSVGYLIIERPNVQVHQQPSTSSEIVYSLEPQDVVNIEKTDQGWYLITNAENQRGWIPEWLINQPELETENNLVVKIEKETPIYSEASTSSQLIEQATPGEIIDIVDEAEGWLRVNYQDQKGFIPTKAQPLANRKDYPSSYDFDNPEIPYDPERIQQAKLEADPIVTARMSQQVFLSEPSREAEIIDIPEINTDFELLEIVYGSGGAITFYHARDEYGNVGYLEAEIASIMADSIGHISKPVATSLKEAVIMIDAGHGGEDAGAVSEEDQLYEKNQTLATAQQMKTALEDAGATVLLTREDDSEISLEDRTLASNVEGVDIFLSIHYDDAIDDSWSGITTYFFHQSDEELANSVNDQLTDKQIGNNGTTFGNFYVIRENTRPALLLELGYMSNEEDRKFIQSEEYHQDIAESVTRGLENYFSQQ